MEIFSYREKQLTINSAEYCKSIGLNAYESRLVEFLDENLSISETLSEVFDIGKMSKKESAVLYVYRQGLHRLTLKTYPEGEIIDCVYINDTNGSRYYIPIKLEHYKDKLLVTVNPTPSLNDAQPEAAKRVFVQPDMVSFEMNGLTFYLYTRIKTQENKVIKGMPPNNGSQFTLPPLDNIEFNRTPTYKIPLFEKNGYPARILSQGINGDDRTQDLMIDVTVISSERR